MNGSVTGGIPVPAKRRGYVLTAGVLLVMMLGGTLPVPLYVLWEKQMGFGPLGVTVVFAGLPSRRSVSAGLPLLLVCLATLESALFAEALWLFLVATVVGGVAVGFIFRGGLSELNRLADPGRRAAVVATFFVAAYLGLGLPAVLVGLISLAAGAVDASAYVSGLVAAVVVAAFIVVLRTFGTISAPKPPSTPSDGWCCPEEPATAGTASRPARG